VSPSQAAELAPLHVVVPVRGLHDGKSRLAQAFSPRERERLIAGLLRRTLDVLSAWPPAAAVHVVSRDPELLRAAVTSGASAVAESAPDLNAALRDGRRAALAMGARALLCLPADLPVLTVEALDRLLDAADAALAAGAGRPVAVIAPADAGGGTNALLLAPPDAIELAFGPASLAAHLRAAAEAEASVQLVVEPGLGFDLDTPTDLVRLEPTTLAELLLLGAPVAAAAVR
jgi:2-phospho-L-lactate guanylyltransferase